MDFLSSFDFLKEVIIASFACMSDHIGLFFTTSLLEQPTGSTWLTRKYLYTFINMTGSPVSTSSFMSDINLNLPVLLFLLKHTSVAISFRVLATMTPKKKLMLASIQESPGISQNSLLSTTLQDL